MSHVDLRDFLTGVQDKGQLKKVDGANWDVEMSSIVEVIYREVQHPKPAVLFDNIPGYPPGYQTLFGVLGSTWRVAKALGLDESRIDPLGVAESWYKKSKEIKSIPPKYVKSGPVMENVMTGKDVDTLKFPVPRFHELDKGRYFGTAQELL